MTIEMAEEAGEGNFFRFGVAADQELRACLQADEGIVALHRRPDDWARLVIRNIAASGRFSSDRTIREYASAIWGAKACPVE